MRPFGAGVVAEVRSRQPGGVGEDPAQSPSLRVLWSPKQECCLHLGWLSRMLWGLVSQGGNLPKVIQPSSG